MKLLSGLFEHLPPVTAGAEKKTIEPHPTIRLVAVNRSEPERVSTGEVNRLNRVNAGTVNSPDSTPAKPHHILTAATASPEWLLARDQYMGHLVTCATCYAPTDRYCATGADLRQQYQFTPMEPTL